MHKSPFILGLESSCDETAAAVVLGHPAEDPAYPKVEVLSDVISSQVEIHRKYGGVVPEVASRQHMTSLIPVLQEALAQAQVTLDDLSGIAVTRGPGLVGALLVAVQVAKSIAYAKGLPLIGVHHLEGHLLAPYLRNGEGPNGPPPFPHLGLLVSGGHTSLVLVHGFGSYQILGQTRDDAAGEAFDKVGKLLGLGYPAGPAIDRLAKEGDPTAFPFPRAMLGPKNALDFSFSGMKTSMMTLLRERFPTPPEGQVLSDLCASFQAAVVEQLCRKVQVALAQGASSARALTLTGGVACNAGLRAALGQVATEHGLPFHVAPPRWCTDNAAMIACAGHFHLLAGNRSDLTLNATANLPLA